MDSTKLVRDAQKVKQCLAELPDGRLVAAKDIRMQCPVRFAERSLAQIDAETHVTGIMAIIAEDKYYAVMSVCAMVQLTPTDTTKVDVDGVPYYEFFFEKGSTIIPNTELVRVDTLVYRIYAEIIEKARVPWYMSYLDLAKIFDTAKDHADTSIGENQEVIELIISLISRVRNNRTKYYRTQIKTMDDLKTIKPSYVSLNSVQYGATNTTNKLAGAHFSDGIVSALNNPSERQERIESLLI